MQYDTLSTQVDRITSMSQLPRHITQAPREPERHNYNITA